MYSKHQYVLICSKAAVASLQWTEVRDQTVALTHATARHGSETHNDLKADKLVSFL